MEAWSVTCHLERRRHLVGLVGAGAFRGRPSKNSGEGGRANDVKVRDAPSPSTTTVDNNESKSSTRSTQGNRPTALETGAWSTVLGPGGTSLSHTSDGTHARSKGSIDAGCSRAHKTSGAQHTHAAGMRAMQEKCVVSARGVPSMCVSATCQWLPRA